LAPQCEEIAMWGDAGLVGRSGCGFAEEKNIENVKRAETVIETDKKRTFLCHSQGPFVDGE
jgi:hypothetical protein